MLAEIDNVLREGTMNADWTVLVFRKLSAEWISAYIVSSSHTRKSVWSL